MSHRLRNYLRTHRKKVGLTQNQVAFLLGCKSGSKVSRYERFARVPSLQTGFAYEVIFHVPVKELFAGLYEEVEQETEKRAQRLAAQLARNARRGSPAGR